MASRRSCQRRSRSVGLCEIGQLSPALSSRGEGEKLAASCEIGPASTAREGAAARVVCLLSPTLSSKGGEGEASAAAAVRSRVVFVAGPPPPAPPPPPGGGARPPAP